jgi:hypothetical protein
MSIKVAWLKVLRVVFTLLFLACLLLLKIAIVFTTAP